MKQFSNLTIGCIAIAFIVLLTFLTTPVSVFADSSYVLPYPSAMPGNKFYSLHKVLERIEKYWYFGDFGQFKYSLKESDKYLVEAKILFEYNQYLLAFEALKKSDIYFQQTLPSLLKAQKNGKNIVSKRETLRQASVKHRGVLEKTMHSVPGKFIWTPEKREPTTLDLWAKIEESIKIREKYQ